MTTYAPTDFAVAKRLAADLKKYQAGADLCRDDFPGTAAISDGMVQRLREALHDNGFDDNGDPTG